MLKVKRRRTDGDYRTKKKNQWTPKDYIGNLKPDKLQIVEDLKKKDKDRNRHHFGERTDCHTGNKYELPNQGKYKDICGDRGIGFKTKSFLPANTIAFVSELPGIPCPLDFRAIEKKAGYHFVGRYFHALSDHTMKANIKAMENATDVERANATLEHRSKDYLVNKGVFVEQPGMYSVLETTEDVEIDSFLNLNGYDNEKDYHFGSHEYLAFEKQCIDLYLSNMEAKKKLGGRAQVCKTCCEIYINTKGGMCNTHIKKCQGNLLQRLWESR